MHHFNYRKNYLYCESVKVLDIAEKVDTPFYLYSYKTLIDHYRKIEDAFSSIKPLICFSMKSNSNLSVCRSLVKAGAGLDIVSGGELFKALKIKAGPAKIVYAGVGKTAVEIEDALRAGILFFNAESLPELVMINKIADRLRRRARVAIRVNPQVDAHTHRYITTGTRENKFGVDMKTAFNIFNEKRRFSCLDIIGIHIHIGSQITEAQPFVTAIRKVSSLITALRKAGHRIDYFNIGGGLGIIYNRERPQLAKAFAGAVVPLIKKLSVKLILEPGRFISGNSGILVTKVLYVKESLRKRFVIVDSGMNDLMRPSFYGAYHEIVPVVRRTSAVVRKFDVVGPICESGDFFAKDRDICYPREGEFLAIMSAGAYGFSMASNYNARPHPAEVMVIDGKYYVTRRRESYNDLIRGEIIPEAL